MGPSVWGVVILMFLGKAVAVVEGTEDAAPAVCSKVSLLDALLLLSPSSSSCSIIVAHDEDDDDDDHRAVSIPVEEGDEGALRKAMYLVHKYRDDYVALLFYASWCPFSKDCRSNFNILQSSFPRIRHFAFEESAIRPSILSRYGVHGFPTLFLLNSTMRVRYHGPRTIILLTTFYRDVSGNKPLSVDPASVERSAHLPCERNSRGTVDPQNCPFSWARSPEKLLQQDTYLALATLFVILRLLCFLCPRVVACCGCAWMRHSKNSSLWSLSRACFDRGKKACTVLNPYKSKTQVGGARNACTWTSQSLASVSIGEGSSGRRYSVR